MSFRSVEKRAGRVVSRAIWTSESLKGYTDWPGLERVCRIQRTVVKGSETSVDISVDISYAVTSLSAERASPSRLLGLSREHWTIENRLHWVRDVTFDEDGCQVRSDSVPQTLCAIRNVVIGLLRMSGVSNIAAALRRNAARPNIPLALVGALLISR